MLRQWTSRTLLRPRHITRYLSLPRSSVSLRPSRPVNDTTSVFLRALSSGQIRDKFRNYFEQQQQFRYQPSASLIPHDDKTLLFTNAGMVPWKNYFVHPSTAPNKRLMSVQKCVRAGGKHNDLDNVGFTPRHHTFFEMLGFFSFGDLSKTDAIRMAWQFLTQTLQLPSNRLSITVHEKDEESYRIWRDLMGIPSSAITLHGDKDNFWSMGDEGPCGPCTEIFWDTQQMHLPPEDRWIEIWNIVFMQYNRVRHGQLEPLPIPCVDTGMGLERLASVLQNKVNNFDTDLFTPLKGALKQLINSSGSNALPTSSVYQNIIVDHIRSSAFLVGDGVTPSNVGRGYVLRRIIRRAVRAGQQLGIQDTFLHQLLPALVSSFNNAYPDLVARSSIIASVLEEEERIFRKTLDKGIRLLDQVFGQASHQATKIVPGDIAFQLHATHGFPLDLTRQMAIEKGWEIDEEGYRRYHDQHRASGRASKDMFTGNQSAQDMESTPVAFIGYTTLNTQSTITATSSINKDSNEMSVSIDPCPFYGLGGGQASDTGYLQRENGEEWKVLRVRQSQPGTLVLDIKRATSNQSLLNNDGIQTDERVNAIVDPERRRGCAIHHTATHLLNAALKRVLNKEIMQAGSDVDEHRLRFDFTHGQPLTSNQIKAVESFVNEACLRNIKVITEEMALQDALTSGAVATFSEKYANQVRVVKMAEVSAELCGGTHVHETLSIYPFKIRSETSVAAGTRRIEAVAGLASIQLLQQQANEAEEASLLLKTTPKHLVERIGSLQRQVEQTQDTLQQSYIHLSQTISDRITLQAYHQNIHLIVHLLPADLPQAVLPLRLEQYLHQSPNSVHIVTMHDKVAILLNSTHYPSLHAGQVLKTALQPLGGKGGGKPDHAQGRLPLTTATASDETTTIEKLMASVKQAINTHVTN